MTPLEFIRRYWIDRSRGEFSEAGIGVKLEKRDFEALWLDIPEADEALKLECGSAPKLADLVVLGRKPARRNRKKIKKKDVQNGKPRNEAIVEDAGPWRAYIIELKKSGAHLEDAEHAAEQVGTLASLVFADGWPSDLQLCGVVVYEQKQAVLTDHHKSVESNFRNKYGFSLRFLPTAGTPAELDPAKLGTRVPSFDLLQKEKEALSPAKKAPAKRVRSRG